MLEDSSHVDKVFDSQIYEKLPFDFVPNNDMNRLYLCQRINDENIIYPEKRTREYHNNGITLPRQETNAINPTIPSKVSSFPAQM
jgi:hypothetical protein